VRLLVLFTTKCHDARSHDRKKNVNIILINQLMKCFTADCG